MLTTENFIKRSKISHGDKYDYSLTQYKGKKVKVEIICKIHGIFKQLPINHRGGQGCPECGGSKKSTTELFIKKAIEIYGDKYNYDLVEYVNSKYKVNILCKEHGIFTQIPNDHLKGSGCNKCGGTHKSTTEIFIRKSIEIHGKTYDYELVDYKTNHIYVYILCKDHGIFKQKPNDHLSGYGCPKCSNKSKGEITILDYLIKNNIKYKSQYTFDDLKYKKPLKFDFGILDNNNKLLYLIEYNGIQHYEHIKFYHKTEEDFELSKYKDNLKINYCSRNNLNLLMIKYNEPIEEKLNKIFYKKHLTI